MSVSTAVAAFAPASDNISSGTVSPAPGIRKLRRQLQLAGVELLVGEDAVSRTYLLVDDRPKSDAYWTQLWKLRDVSRLHTAFAGLVVPQCPLLSAETATAVLPSLGLQIPKGSAWVIMRVELTRFLRTGGLLDEPALQRSLETCVDVGEELHDITRWPTPDLQHDAWLNRRLAITITGLGDLLQRRNMDPGDHDSLRFLNQLLVRIREMLLSRSRALAQRSEQLPAIALSDPSHSLPSGGVREDWRRCWRQAVQASLVRHRNLLVLSPWALFPTGTAADFRYAELLPLLRHADACAVNKTVSIAHWNPKEFKCFHQRARAVLQQRSATSLIAKHV
jgi:hypothetical protein